VTAVAALAKRYDAAVQRYLSDASEEALQEAYEVGRQALETGLGPLVLFSIHRDVVAKLPPSSIDAGEFVSQVTTVFTEALAPFEMTYASFDEARGAVDELGTMFQEHSVVLEGIRERLDRMHETTAVRRRLIADIVSAQEEERRRLAGEIHDDAVQAMTVVLLRLGILARQLPQTAELEVMVQLESSVRDSISRLRQLIAGLAPPELERAGLARAVRTLLEQITAESDIDTRVDDRLEAEPGAEVRAIAFRIVQEALANARKHASPTRIDVVLESSAEGTIARVTDDGVGFDVDAALQDARPGHLGLAAMRERVELAGGWLRIESGADGTSMSCCIPAPAGR
jgi:signal transduction histidine kinase